MSTLSTYTTAISIGGVPITGITNLSGPSESLTMLDSTSLADSTMTRIAGLIDAGEVSLTIDYDPDVVVHASIRTALTTRASAVFVISWPDAAAVTTFTFTGYVSSFAPSADTNGKLTAAVTITITGAITAA